MALTLVGETSPDSQSSNESLGNQPTERAITRRFLARLSIGCLFAGGTLTAVLLGVGNHYADRAEAKADETIEAVQGLKDEAAGLREDVRGARKDLDVNFGSVSTKANDLDLRACALLEQLGVQGPGLEGCEELLVPPAAGQVEPEGKP